MLPVSQRYGFTILEGPNEVTEVSSVVLRDLEAARASVLAVRTDVSKADDVEAIANS